MCATASRWCASPARPMCCRAPASAAFPVVSVNTTAVALEIYRIGDRNLLDTVVGRDFQRNLDRYDIEPPDRRARRAGLERRDDGRADAQHRRHHRVSGRRGDRHARAGVYVMVAQASGAAKPIELRIARDPVVHRLRSRADRVLRQRRHPRLRAFARDRAAEGRGRGPAALAQQRGPGDASAPATPATCSSRPT